ncbi:Uncharacterised protein [Serratia fonticola]|nr:Uncharacterised protein [Serratia fonticola]CAI2023005.1 Uncharacterised protein [Serratia fonticola]
MRNAPYPAHIKKNPLIMRGKTGMVSMARKNRGLLSHTQLLGRSLLQTRNLLLHQLHTLLMLLV